MSARHAGGCAATALAFLLAGCHHHATVRAVAPLPPAPANAGPVMVSVPPPQHRSTDTGDDVTTSSNIPVVKPVRPPRKSPRRTRSTPPLVAANTPPAVMPPVTAPPVPSPVQPPAPAQDLGQLTASTDDPGATRDGSARAMRRERERLAGIPGPVQAAHAAEIEQARRFLKSATDSWNASDYAAALALTTKARVLLDDLLK